MKGLRQLLAMGGALLIGALACARTQTATKPAAARPPQPSYELRLGKAVFSHYCQTCHGETGAGDGFNAFNLDPRPKDLSDPALQKTKSDADLADAIRRGGAGVGLSPLMPPYGHTLSSRQIEVAILYLRTLRKEAAPAAASPAAPAAPSPATPAAASPAPPAAR
jgi:mono/diheme cytochrome c family protein